MKNNWKILFFLSLVANIFFIFYSFPSLQMKLRFFIIQSLGYSTSKEIPIIKRKVLIEDFQPISILETTDKREKKIPVFPVFETHGHLGFPFAEEPEEITKKLDKLNILKFIHLSFKTGEEFKKIREKYKDKRIVHFSTFNWKRIKESENFVPLMLDDLKKDISNGTKGIKLGKISVCCSGKKTANA